MDKIRIFCEGTSDQRFLRDFLELNYGIILTDKQLDSNTFIHCLKGWSNLTKLRTTITDTYSEYISLIFIDADDVKTIGKSGIKESQEFIDNLMADWEWTKYDKFIFPNNSDSNGEVEDFLEKIINPENSEIFECWDSFENCLTGKNKGYNIPAKKSKIYVYHEALHGDTNTEKEKCKDKMRDFKNTKLWELDVKQNVYLKTLKEFLDQYLP